MTGYQSKKAAAQDKLNEDDDTQVYGDALTIAYQSGYHDGKKQRPWVGLTFDEKQHALYISDWKTTYMEAVIEYLEAKLKEKNT